MLNKQWDPVARLQDALVLALQARGTTVKVIPIVRRHAGGRTALRRDDIPPDAGVHVFLDADVYAVYVAEAERKKGYRPGMVVQYLWITASGHPIGVRRAAVFNSDIGHRGQAVLAPVYGASEFPENVAPAANCLFAGLDEIEADVPRFRECFETGIEELARQIAATMPLQP